MTHELYLNDRWRGTLKPHIGASRRQFIHRCQTFTGARPDMAQFLRECLDIRSYAKHLHDRQNAVSHGSPTDRGPYLARAVRRLESTRPRTQ